MLSTAQDRASKYRFLQDSRELLDTDRPVRLSVDAIVDSGLPITGALLPKVEEALCRCCDRLGVERSAVMGYVVNDGAPNAFCYPFAEDVCVVSVTSALIELLDIEELGFVLGHEIGHFLLGHVFEKTYTPHPANVAFLQEKRAKEISADRIGLLGAGSLEGAVRAMIKTQSGLSSRHLRFDFAAFIDSIRNRELRSGDKYQTHPSFYVRARFVLWASMLPSVDSADFKEHKRKIDNRVSAELEKLLDQHSTQEREEALKILSFWLYVKVSSAEGSLPIDKQRVLKSLGFETELARFSQMVDGMGKGAVATLLDEKLHDARSTMTMFDRDGGRTAWMSLMASAEQVLGVDQEEIRRILS